MQRIRHVGPLESQCHLVGLVVDLDRLGLEVLAEDVAADLLVLVVSQHGLDGGDIDFPPGVGPGPGAGPGDFDEPPGSVKSGGGISAVARRHRVLEVLLDLDGERQFGMLDRLGVFIRVEELRGNAFLGQRHHGDLVVILRRGVDDGQFDGADVVLVIDRVPLADAHLALDGRNTHQQLVVHHQQHAQVQQHHAGAAFENHDASRQHHAAGDQSLGQLPEDSQRRPFLQQLVLLAALHRPPQDHSGRQCCADRDHGQSRHQPAALGLDLEADRVSGQQVDGHCPADQPASGEREPSPLLDIGQPLQRRSHEERLGKEDPPLDPGDIGPEVVADDFPDVLVDLGHGAGQYQENGHRKQGNGDLQRGNRTEYAHDGWTQRRCRRVVDFR